MVLVFYFFGCHCFIPKLRDEAISIDSAVPFLLSNGSVLFVEIASALRASQ